MTSITLILTGASIRSEVDGVLTSGMVGIPVTIRYDDAWNGLIKNLVCRCGKWGGDRDEIRTVLSVDETATVAHEVMKAGKHLYLGVEGHSTDGKLVIPTTWADCGVILYGANAGADPSTDPELSVWAQLQAQIEQIKQDTVTEEDIVAAVAAYMEENPIETPDSSQNVNNSDVGNIKIVLGNIMNILKAQVEDEDGTPQGYNMNVSGLITQNDTLIAALGASDDSGGSGVEGGDETHTHSYTSVVTTAATCTTAGVRTYTCDCGASCTESIPATGHNYVDGVCTVCAAASEGDGVPNDSEKALISISAAYSGGDVAVGTAVSKLTGIVVTAHYSDSTSETVTGYTLNGTIVEGENIITVSYGGMTTTFTVTGVAEETGLAQHEYTVAGMGLVNDTGLVDDSSSYRYTDFIEVDAGYDTMTIACYLDAISDAKTTVYTYTQWFDGDTFLTRTSGGIYIAAGDLKGVRVHAKAAGATKFRVSVQSNCPNFMLYKGAHTVDEV